MCEYCKNKALNKPISDVDNDKEDFVIVSFLHVPMLRVELNAEDEDGYKVCDFFRINYCPMCGRRLEDGRTNK